jgi:hypothetical protein
LARSDPAIRHPAQGSASSALSLPTSVTSAQFQYMATAHHDPPFSYDLGAEIVDASNIAAIMAREAIFNT